jgi:MFS family permease
MSPLRGRSFRRLWVAGLISDTGDWLLLVSLPILVYQYTHSTLGTAAAFLVELVPPVLLAPLAGRVADRLDRRRTLMWISLAQAAGLTPLLLVEGRTGLPIVYVVVFAQAAWTSSMRRAPCTCSRAWRPPGGWPRRTERNAAAVVIG